MRKNNIYEFYWGDVNSLKKGEFGNTHQWL